jgi:hypothetical protein
LYIVIIMMLNITNIIFTIVFNINQTSNRIISTPSFPLFLLNTIILIIFSHLHSWYFSFKITIASPISWCSLIINGYLSSSVNEMLPISVYNILILLLQFQRYLYWYIMIWRYFLLFFVSDVSYYLIKYVYLYFT